MTASAVARAVGPRLDRRSLLISNADHIVLLQNPISAGLPALAAIFALAPSSRQLRAGHRPAADPATKPPLKG